MLTLNDGRSELWQWDTGRTLAVDADCSQVHFSNKVFGRSIDVDVVDGAAIIPDVLLQTDKDLNVWAFVGTAENGYTKISKTFKVNRRNKPADYVFTPPEQTTLAELVGRLDKIEESQDPDAIKNAVGDYLDKNPVEAPVQSVNGKTGTVELTAEDVGAISDETDPTVPAWAKQPTKPTYTAAEVGALPDTYTLPIATEDTLGGVKPVTATAAMTQPVGVDAEGHLMTRPGSGGSGISVTGATVGQTVKISAVDENGVPTAWEPVDFPSGRLEYINSVTIENAETISIELPLGAEYKAVLISSFAPNASSGNTKLVTANVIKLWFNNGENCVTAANVNSGHTPTVNRTYSYYIEEAGEMFKFYSCQTIISGGISPGGTMVYAPRNKNVEPGTYIDNVAISTVNGGFFVEGVTLYFYGVRV